MFCPFFCPKNGPILNLVPPAETTNTVGWPSGPRRQFKALVSSEAWVRIPLQSYVPVSLVGQDTRLSPVRPGFKSRTGNIFFFSICAAPARAPTRSPSWCSAEVPGLCASRAPLAERAAVNRQVLGSIPSGGAYFFLFFCPLYDPL